MWYMALFRRQEGHPFTHSLIHSLIHLLIHSVHSHSSHTLIHSFTHSFTHPLTHICTFSYVQSSVVYRSSKSWANKTHKPWHWKAIPWKGPWGTQSKRCGEPGGRWALPWEVQGEGKQQPTLATALDPLTNPLIEPRSQYIIPYYRRVTFPRSPQDNK